MKKYYKIVSQNTYLRRIYDLQSSFYIPNGTKITATAPFADVYNSDNSKNGQFYINKPVMHFCDNAFDTMLWYNVFYRMAINKHHGIAPVVYEIKPITNVIKERCCDKNQIYQCGAHIIEFKAPVVVDNMLRRAVLEFLKEPEKKFEMYPNLEIGKIINAWANYKQPSRLAY